MSYESATATNTTPKSNSYTRSAASMKHRNIVLMPMTVCLLTPNNIVWATLALVQFTCMV